MPRWQIPPNLHSETIGGPLCYFAEHSIGSRDGRVPRYSDSHACVRCISALTEGRLTLDVHKIHKKHRRRFLEFWSMVDIQDAEDCWHWRGALHSRNNSGFYSIPRHWNSGRNFSSPRVATWFTWGDVGRLPLDNICGNHLCCNPLHIRVRGVPHFFHNRKLQLVDLEFHSHKLMRETQEFLAVSRERTPQRFADLERLSNKWIYVRMEQDGPVSADDLEQVLDGDDEVDLLDQLE